MLPSPPMTTTTKASTMTPIPMPRYAVVMGAAATPPSPASAQAAPNTSVRTRATSAPETVRHLAVLGDGADDEPGTGLALEIARHQAADHEPEDDQEQPVARVQRRRAPTAPCRSGGGSMPLAVLPYSTRTLSSRIRAKPKVRRSW